MHDELKHIEKTTAEMVVALLATHLWILSEFDNDINTLGHYDRFFAEVEALTGKKINDLIKRRTCKGLGYDRIGILPFLHILIPRDRNGIAPYCP